jgi:hypothetical protein
MKKLSALLAGTALMLAFSTSSYAIPMTLALTDATNTVTVTDGESTPYLDSNPVAGAITYAGGNGVWEPYDVQTGLSKPALQNTHTLAQMQLNFSATSTSSNKNQTLKITLTDDGFKLIPSKGTATFSISGSASSGSTVLYQIYLDGILLGSKTFNGSGAITAPGSFSFTSAKIPVTPLSSSFDLEEVITITNSKAATASGNAYLNVSAVPEPGTMMLLGVGMFGMAIYGKRRMNKEA